MTFTFNQRLPTLQSIFLALDMFKKVCINILLILCILSLMPELAIGQAVPGSQVFVFHLNKATGGKYFLEDPRWITNFNPNGYNNQPAFINGMWHLSVRLPESDQNEIVALDLPTRELRWITNTPESEYSPTKIPGKSGEQFSVVRVEADSSQLLWQYDLSSDYSMKNVVQKEKMVGYTRWLNASKVALFLVGDPISLVVGDLQSGKTDFITSRIGRSLHSNDQEELFFTQRITEGAPWQLKKIVYGGFRPELITTSPGENQDFCLLPDGNIMMGSGSMLYRFMPGQSTTWEFVADLALYGAKSISRLAINEYQEIAIVFDY